MNSPVPAGLASVDGSTNRTSTLVRQAVLEDDLSMKVEVVANLDCFLLCGRRTDLCVPE